MHIGDYSTHMRTDGFDRSNGMEHGSLIIVTIGKGLVLGLPRTAVRSTSSLDPSSAGRASNSHVDSVSSKEQGLFEKAG